MHAGSFTMMLMNIDGESWSIGDKQISSSDLFLDA